MPKKAICTRCRTPLTHKKKYKITEEEGRGSGKQTKQIESLCEKCYEELERFGETLDNWCKSPEGQKVLKEIVEKIIDKVLLG